MTEVGPPFLPEVDGRAQVHLDVLEAHRAELHPPLEELGLPRLQRPLQPAIVGEIAVVAECR